MISKKIIDSEIEKRDFASGGEVSSKLKSLLRKLGVNNLDIRRVSIITYELEMNLIIHSEGGNLKVFINPNRIEILSEDRGPGIEDIKRAFEPGYTTATDEIREMGFGAGMGLNNVKRFSDDLEVESKVNKFTKLKAIININN